MVLSTTMVKVTGFRKTSYRADGELKGMRVDIMEWKPEDIRMLIRDRLSHDPFSQEYVDILVEKAFRDLSATQPL